jgi:hypothetical protein
LYSRRTPNRIAAADLTAKARGRAKRYPERSRRWHPLKKTGEKR